MLRMVTPKESMLFPNVIPAVAEMSYEMGISKFIAQPLLVVNLQVQVGLFVGWAFSCIYFWLPSSFPCVLIRQGPADRDVLTLGQFFPFFLGGSVQSLCCSVAMTTQQVTHSVWLKWALEHSIHAGLVTFTCSYSTDLEGKADSAQHLTLLLAQWEERRQAVLVLFAYFPESLLQELPISLQSRVLRNKQNSLRTSQAGNRAVAFQSILQEHALYFTNARGVMNNISLQDFDSEWCDPLRMEFGLVPVGCGNLRDHRSIEDESTWSCTKW